jgi:hypothetical protein
MNKNRDQDITAMFIVRRAFRHGTVSRADLLKAFNMSSATATRTMSNVVAKFGNILERRGRNIEPRPLAECPSYASEADLLKNIDSGKSDAVNTGLFERELPITYVSWTNSMPPRPGTLQTIVTAIKCGKQIDIVYLGLKFGAQPKSRKILPLGLEKMNDQWRVVAQDIESQNFPVKIFVLPRILAANISTNNKRIPYTKSYIDSHSKLHVTLHYKYTSLQKEMLEHEMKVKNGEVIIASRSAHEFKRRFTNTPVSENVVWPPLVIKEV